MNNYRQIFSLLITILVISNCTPTKLSYIKFGEEKTVNTDPDIIQLFENRLDIKSEFVELGVIIIEGSKEPDIDEIRLLAVEKGADGIIEEGKNFVLIKILNENKIKIQKLNLINENNSPLHRIMWLYRFGTTNLKFKNNVSSFHIGNGIVISVAHNLRNSDRLPMMVSDNYYENELLTKIDAADSALFNQAYPNIQNLNYRILTTTVQSTATSLANKLDTAKVDRRYKKLYADKSCKPFLVLTFRNNAFFGDTSLNAYFDASHSLYEQDAKRYTFLIELELLDELVNEDIAIYRIINTDQSIINKLPYIDIDFNLYDIGTANYYCLQTAPYKEIGRLLNEARIEGVLDNYSTSKDILGNLYIMDGTRYLIQGYFRFGSSGAPYVIYDEENQVFKANAVQSQASYIQMAINNDKKGNFQYINAIAIPFSIIEEKVKEILNKAKKK